MPNIILSAPGVEAQGVVNNRVERPEDQAVYQAATGLEKLGGALAQIEERTQTIKAAEETAKMQADLSVWLKEREAAGDVDNLGQRLAEEKNKRVSRLKEGNSSMFYRQAVDERGVSAFASLIGQAENAVINGRFKEQQDGIQKLIDAQMTVVSNDPAGWKNEVAKAEDTINKAVLPADVKAAMSKRARHGMAYISALTDLQTNPSKLKKDLQSGAYEGSLSAEEIYNYLSGSEENILKDMLSGDLVTAKKFIKDNKGYFTTIPEKAALAKIDAVSAAREKEALEQDRVNRALYELNFWNEPTWGKLEQYDFRGDEKKKEKWEERLAQVPNPSAKTVYNSVDEISAAIDALGEIPADTGEERAKLVEKATDLTTAIAKMNSVGNLSVEDMRKYNESVGRIAINATLKKDLKAMRPQADAFRAAWHEIRDMKDITAQRKAGADLNRAQARAMFRFTPSSTERILADGYANFISEIAKGDKDNANKIYQDTLIAARNDMYPFLFGREKGDVIVDENGTAMTFAGYDGVKPVFNWGK